MKRLSEPEFLIELSKYKHSITGQVKFHEVDSAKVIHNVQYFYYCEWARTKYFEYIGMDFNKNSFTSEFPLMTVHNEIDYYNSGHLSENYEILTRTRQIGKSSIVMDNIVRLIDGTILIKATITLVYMNIDDNRPMRIPDNFRDMIIGIEGNIVEIIEK